MKTFFYIFCSLFLGSQFAFAQSSEFLFQAPEKQHVLTLNFNTTAANIEDVGMSGVDYLALEYEYGISDKLSTYVSLSYIDTVLVMPQYGMGPTQFGVKYLAPDIGPGSLYGRLNVSAALIDGSEISCGSTHCNVNDGSIAVDFDLAYQWNLKDAYTGFLLNYGLFSTDAKYHNDDDQEKKGFLTISAFYERNITETNLWGTSLSYINKGGLSGGAYLPPIIMGPFINYSELGAEPDFDSLRLRGYLKTKVSETFDSIIELGLTRLIDGDDAIGEKTRFVNLNFALRKKF